MIDSTGMAALVRLVRLGHDTIRACDRALDAIDDPRVAAQLRQIRDEHRRDADAIAAVIQRYGEEPPGPAGVGSRTTDPGLGSESALRDVLERERRSERAVREALRAHLEPDVRALLQRRRVQDERHRRFVEEVLDWRTWEERATP